MLVYPDVQKKAQVELDRVVGTERLVNYDNQSSLPYTQAICREIFRWRPILPLSVFHAATAEDIYKGYYIPRGENEALNLALCRLLSLPPRTTIVPNVWAMTRDPVKYKNPEKFNPDLYFEEDGELNKDDMTYTFGFGRRRVSTCLWIIEFATRDCPGRHLTQATVWLSVAAALAAFDIGPVKDTSGKDIARPEVEYSGGMIRSCRTKQLIIDAKSTSTN